MSSRVRPFVTPWTVLCQAPLPMGFSWQEYWSGLPFPPPGDLPDPDIKPMSSASPALAGRFLTTEPFGNPSTLKKKKSNHSCRINVAFITTLEKMFLLGKEWFSYSHWTHGLSWRDTQSLLPQIPVKLFREFDYRLQDTIAKCSSQCERLFASSDLNLVQAPGTPQSWVQPPFCPTSWKYMATCSNILAWKIPWTRNLVGYSPRGRKKLHTTEQLSTQLEKLSLCTSLHEWVSLFVGKTQMNGTSRSKGYTIQMWATRTPLLLCLRSSPSPCSATDLADNPEKDCALPRGPGHGSVGRCYSFLERWSKISSESWSETSKGGSSLIPPTWPNLRVTCSHGLPSFTCPATSLP